MNFTIVPRGRDQYVFISPEGETVGQVTYHSVTEELNFGKLTYQIYPTNGGTFWLENTTFDIQDAAIAAAAEAINRGWTYEQWQAYENSLVS